MFNKLLENYSAFKTQSPYLIQYPHRILPISLTEKYIQILHSGSGDKGGLGIIGKTDGYWVCCYYNTRRISIYNSLSKKKNKIKAMKFFYQNFYQIIDLKV